MPDPNGPIGALFPAAGAPAGWPRRAVLRGAGAAAGVLALGGRGWARAAVATPTIDGQWPATTRMIADLVAGHRLPGAMAAFGWGQSAPGFIARGTLGPDNAAPLTGDALFRVYSMTKPLTGMIAMMLIDEGRLGLDQPLAELFPAFARMTVASDPVHGLAGAPAKTAITMRHLMTHTAGLAYPGLGHDAPSLDLVRQGVVLGRLSAGPVPGFPPSAGGVGAEDFLRLAAAAPLLFEPGTKWRYSMGLDILGLVIAHVEGKPLEAVMAERLFAPLGMTSSFFTVPAGELHRMTSDSLIADGQLSVADPGATTIDRTPPPFAFGGSGLVTSAADYDRFLAMIAQGGVWNGRRVMSAKAVALGVSNLLPAGADLAGTWVDGWGFGAGGRVGLLAHAGTFGWSGLAGTVAFVQTTLGLRAGLYVQYLPNGALGTFDDFAKTVRTDLLARPPQDFGA